MAGGCIPCTQEGSGAFGARVLSFVRFAPNDGFRPQSGLVQRELYSIAAAESGIRESKRGRPPKAGRGSALRFRAGRGLCRRVVKAMTAGKNYPVTLTSYSSPEGRYHHPRPKGPSPLSTQPAAAGGHNLQPRRGWPPSPLNLLNPLNPLNPGRRRRPYLCFTI